MPAKKSPANQALARAIRAARAERGYSQESFAASAGIDRSYYGAVERGEFNVSLDTIVRIASSLGTTSRDLLGRAGL
jgi:transcriptional regulator with XRE-family HTH domain